MAMLSGKQDVQNPARAALVIAEQTKQDDTIRMAYANAGAVPVLLQLLNSSHEAMLYTRAAAALCNLSICVDTHPIFIEANAIQIGLQNLKSKNRILAGGAALMLANLAKTTHIGERMIKQHALAQLAGAMGSWEEAQLQATFADAVARLTLTRNQDLPAESEEVLKQVCVVLQKFETNHGCDQWSDISQRVVEKYLKALHNMVSQALPSCRLLGRDSKSMACIVYWVRNGSTTAKLHAVSILKWLVKNNFVAEVAKVDGVQAVIQCLNAKDPYKEVGTDVVCIQDVRKGALATLAEFCSHGDSVMCKALIESDALNSIIGIVGSSRPSLRALATKALSCMCKHAALREQLLASTTLFHLLAALDQSLKAGARGGDANLAEIGQTGSALHYAKVGNRSTFHDEHTQMWASAGVKHLVSSKSPEALKQLQEARGIPVVLNALTGGSLEYTRKQALGISVAIAVSNSTSASVELCQEGGARHLLSTMRQALLSGGQNANKQWIAWTSYGLDQLLQQRRCVGYVVEAFKVDSGKELAEAGAVTEQQIAEVVRKTLVNQIAARDSKWV